MKKKTRESGGFSLAETLLAILILLLVSVIVANGIPVAKNAYQKIVLTANAQVLLSTTVNALQDELGTAWDVKIENIYVNGISTKALTYFSAGTGARSAIYPTTDSKGNPVIMLQENYAVVNLGVENYGTPRLLVSDVNNSALSSLYVTYGEEDDKDVELVIEKGKTIGVKFTGLKVYTKDRKELLGLEELTIGLYFN